MWEGQLQVQEAGRRQEPGLCLVGCLQGRGSLVVGTWKWIPLKLFLWVTRGRVCASPEHLSVGSESVHAKLARVPPLSPASGSKNALSSGQHHPLLPPLGPSLLQVQTRQFHWHQQQLCLVQAGAPWCPEEALLLGL